MIAENIIAGIRESGATIAITDGKLRVTPASILTAGQKVAIRNFKADIVEFLTQRDPLIDRLLKLAESEFLPLDLVEGIPVADLADIEGESDAVLAAYLRALADTAKRKEGIAPPSHTTAALCAHCGPVWLDPELARKLPIVNGWPRCEGCPWCHVDVPFQRPPVTSATCKHHKPNEINPAGGLSECHCGWYHPFQRHTCDKYLPARFDK